MREVDITNSVAIPVNLKINHNNSDEISEETERLSQQYPHLNTTFENVELIAASPKLSSLVITE